MAGFSPSASFASTNGAFQQGGGGSESAFRQFSTAPAYAPWVISPASFADGGPVQWNARSRMMADVSTPRPPELQPMAPHEQVPPIEPMPSHGPSVEAAGVARSVAESLARMDPRAAAAVYADLTGLPTQFSPEDTQRAYRMLALHSAGLLAARPTAPPSSPIQWNARSRLMASPVAAETTIPLRRSLGGRTPPTFARDGHVPGKASVRGDSERNDVVPAMLSPGEIVIPRTIAQSPDAPREAASFVASLSRRGRPGSKYAGGRRYARGGLAKRLATSRR